MEGTASRGLFHTQSPCSFHQEVNMKAEDCVYYIAPKFVGEPEPGMGYMTSAMCGLVDKYCIIGNTDEECPCYLEEEE